MQLLTSVTDTASIQVGQGSSGILDSRYFLVYVLTFGHMAPISPY
jgi:hypothetical protein